MEQPERSNAAEMTVCEPDKRKPWLAPAVITPAEIKEWTGFTAGPAGDNYLSSNATS